MTRHGFIDYGDYEGACEDSDCGECDLCLWRARLDEAIKSQAGQAFLREMIPAIEREPRLCSSVLLSTDGEVCAIGAVLRSRGVEVEAEEADDEWGADYCGDYAAGLAKIPEEMAQEIMYENDEWPDEVRKEHMLAWARAHLVAQEGEAC